MTYTKQSLNEIAKLAPVGGCWCKVSPVGYLIVGVAMVKINDDINFCIKCGKPLKFCPNYGRKL